MHCIASHAPGIASLRLQAPSFALPFGKSAVRLLIINPNISESVTALIEAEARATAPADVSLTMMTAPAGVAYIETRFEALLGAYATAQLAAEHIAGHDALIVAAFGDPGLDALREVMPVPVLGMTESALASACLLGQRFSIIAISQRIQAWYRQVVESHGLIGRLASIRALDQPLANIATVQGDHEAGLRALINQAVDEDGADVIIVAGAPLAGLARKLRGTLPVPVVDGVSSAVRHAITLVELQSGKATRGSFAPPPLKPNQGLPESIARLLNRS